MHKHMCMDDPRHSDKTANVTVLKAWVKNPYMDDLRYLNISNKSHIHKHVQSKRYS